jgi:hypothetical protein
MKKLVSLALRYEDEMSEDVLGSDHSPWHIANIQLTLAIGEKRCDFKIPFSCLKPLHL